MISAAIRLPIQARGSGVSTRTPYWPAITGPRRNTGETNGTPNRHPDCLGFFTYPVATGHRARRCTRVQEVEMFSNADEVRSTSRTTT